jgi:hypothetical protein
MYISIETSSSVAHAAQHMILTMQLVVSRADDDSCYIHTAFSDSDA